MFFSLLRFRVILYKCSNFYWEFSCRWFWGWQFDSSQIFFLALDKKTNSGRFEMSETMQLTGTFEFMPPRRDFAEVDVTVQHAFTISEVCLTATLDVRVDLRCGVAFAFMGRHFQFIINEVGAAAFQSMWDRFHMFYQVGQNQCGLSEADFSDTFGLGSSASTREQRVAVVVQTVKDVLSCVDRIISVHAGASMGYSVWHLYIFDAPGPLDYGRFVAKIAARIIFENHIMFPGTQYQLIVFE